MYVHDAAAQAAFWCEALGYVEQPVPDGFTTWEEALLAFGYPEERLGSGGAIVDPDGVAPRIFFHEVPEDKPDQMNRLHLDVVVGDPDADEQERRAAQRAEADRLRALGATEVGRVEDLGESWIVLRDPEGNEFDLV
jgi:hypothetical protein